MAKNNGINWRFFTSIYMAYSLLLMTITGIVLYIAPPGRIAHWSSWTFIGFTKTEWQALHTIFSFLFVISGTFHVIYNWKPLMHYISEKAKAGKKLRKEFSLVTLTVVVFFIMTYFNIPPFGSFMDLGEYITESWENPENTPPIPHAELLTVGEFSRTINMPITQIKQKLRKAGIEIKDTNQTIADLASDFKMNPNDIYNLLKTETRQTAGAKFVQGSGFGQKKLSMILKESNISWEDGVKMLSAQEIKVKGDDKLKNIAEENNISPLEIIKALGLK